MILKQKLYSSIFCFILVFTTIGCSCGSSWEGTIVSAEDSAPIEGATITVLVDSKEDKVVYTNNEGMFEASYLSHSDMFNQECYGSCTLEVSMTGYQSVTVKPKDGMIIELERVTE